MEITATGILSSGQSATPRAILTFPTVTALADGSLALSIETNKHYHDASPWMQKVVFFHSSDQGQTWGEPVVAGEDPTGRIFNWDLRCGVAVGVLLPCA